MSTEINTRRVHHSLIISFSVRHGEALFDSELLAGLNEIFSLADDDATLTSIVLSDRGQVLRQPKVSLTLLRDWLMAVQGFSKPLIGVPGGPCTGTGAIIALSADTLVCGPGATLGLHGAAADVLQDDMIQTLLQARLPHAVRTGLLAGHAAAELSAERIFQLGLACELHDPALRDADVILDQVCERFQSPAVKLNMLGQRW